MVLSRRRVLGYCADFVSVCFRVVYAVVFYWTGVCCCIVFVVVDDVVIVPA